MDNNVKYCEAIKDAIIAMGHTCKLLFADQHDVIHKLQMTVLPEELKCREASNEPALEKGTETQKFLEDWTIEHEVALTHQLGMEDGPPLKFLTGILTAMSTSKKQVPFLEEVIRQMERTCLSVNTPFFQHMQMLQTVAWLRWDLQSSLVMNNELD